MEKIFVDVTKHKTRKSKEEELVLTEKSGFKSRGLLNFNKLTSDGIPSKFVEDEYRVPDRTN